MTALAEGELAQRFPHGKRVYSAENSFHFHMGCESIKDQTFIGFCLQFEAKPTALLF